MRQLGALLTNWGPPAFSVTLTAFAVWFAWSRGGSAAEAIRRVDSLGTSLSEMAGTAKSAILTQSEYVALEAKANDVRSRVEDSGKSALIAVQITEAVHRAGARFIGSEPMADPSPSGRGQGAPRYPHHRVTIEGGFRQIAAFLDGCGAQRLPVRVTDFAITRSASPNEGTAVLRAVITVESYLPSKKLAPIGDART